MARLIKPALFNIIESKLRDNGSAQKAIEENDARSLFVFAAQACVGETENGKDNYGTFVELCQKTVDNKAIGESWCMGFIQSIIAYVEEKTKVKSIISADENCLKVWEKTQDSQRVKNYPAVGAIAIWRHPSASTKVKRNPTGEFVYEGKGHTGIVLEFDPSSTKNTMKTIEGNTPTPAGTGYDGVKINTRNKVTEGDFEILGFLIPFPKK
jgi:hypothetical protein